MNTRSIPSHLQIFIDQYLHDGRINFDVIGFSETRLDKDIASLYNMPQYNSYGINRDRNGEGVCMYVSAIYNSSMLFQCCMMERFLECVCVYINSNDKKIFLASVYKGSFINFLDVIDSHFNFLGGKNYSEFFFFFFF